MSDEVLAPIIVVVILLVMFLWVPTLDICNERCQKFLRGRTRKPGAAAGKAPPQERDRLRDVA